jgi:glycosyltransferase involved in cell wall biosynthesis
MFGDKITIGLPFYNNADTLGLALESIICQSYTNWVLILINDGSTDDSDLIVKKYLNTQYNIIYINDTINRGLIYRLNQIIDLTDTEYLARMDADDIMFKNRIEKQMSFLTKNNEYDLVSSGAIIINNQNEITGFRDCSQLDNFNYSNLFSRSYIIHPTAVFRTNWIKQNLYSSEYIRAEDLELWCRTFHDSNFFRISEPLLFYREGNVNIKNYILSMQTKLKIIDKYGIKIVNNYTIQLLKFSTKLKIIIYFIFGIFNLQFLLTNFRNKKISVSNSINYKNYINILIANYFGR